MMFVLQLQLWLALLPVALAGNLWDQFASNLASDLAPILQLFGEQVTKQYLSESTSIYDHIIFAMAPLGVLTAIVSVIRVCGSPVFRSFIGRAQEGVGIAETELCSSTGRDLCEMYKKGAITRIFGQPSLLELVHVPNSEDFYTPQGESGVASAGLYTFKEYYNTKRGKQEWDEIGSRSIKSNDEKSMHSRKSDEESTTSPESDVFAPYPNLMLNIGCKAPQTYVLRSVALFAVFLQASVIIYAIIAQDYLKLTSDGELPPSWAVPTMVIGTVLLCTGMGMCAWLIDRTTKERSFKRTRRDDRSVMHWIQAGGQVIGDQTFDSFAYDDKQDPIDRFTSSWRDEERNSQESVWTWFAVAIATAGFVIQFVGLRAGHSTVSVYQLGAVLLMAIIRSLMRRRRPDLDRYEILAESNAQGKDALHVRGHELDWLSHQLYKQHSSRRSQTSNTWRSWSIYQWQPSQPSITESVPEEDFQRLGTERECPLWIGTKDAARNRQWLAQQEASSEAHPNAAAETWRYRSRLSQLTSLSNEISTMHAWPKERVQTRSLSRALTQALSKTITLILEPLRYEFSSRIDHAETIYLRFLVDASADAGSEPENDALNVNASSSNSSTRMPSSSWQSIFFTLNKTNATGPVWSPKLSEVEAALALSVWSLLDTQAAQGETDSQTPVEFKRLLGRKAVIYPRIKPWKHASDIRFDTEILCFGEVASLNGPTGNQSTSSGLASLWKSGPSGYARIPPGSSNRMSGVRFFGWNTLSLDDVSGRESTCVSVAAVKGSVEQMCAQDIFTGFLKALLLSSKNSLVRSKTNLDTNLTPDSSGDTVHTFYNTTVDDIMDIFVDTGLGSISDAAACIIPMVIAYNHTTHVTIAIRESSDIAMEHFSKDNVGMAYHYMKWTIPLLYQGAPAEIAVDCYVAMAGLCYDLGSESIPIKACKGAHLLLTNLGELEYDTDTKRFLYIISHRLGHVVKDMTKGSTSAAVIYTNECIADELAIPTQYLDDRRFRAVSDLLSAIKQNDASGALICAAPLRKGEYLTDDEGRGVFSLLASCSGEQWDRRVYDRLMPQSIVRGSDRDISLLDFRDALQIAFGNSKWRLIDSMIRLSKSWAKSDEQHWLHFRKALQDDRRDILESLQENTVRLWLRLDNESSLKKLLSGKDPTSDIMKFLWDRHSRLLRRKGCVQPKLEHNEDTASHSNNEEAASE